jgi:hypothetical protein
MNLEPINYFEPTNSAEMLARRKESARHTLRTASPEELHALVNGPVHAASDNSNKNYATRLQETSSIQDHRSHSMTYSGP